MKLCRNLLLLLSFFCSHAHGKTKDADLADSNNFRCPPECLGCFDLSSSPLSRFARKIAPSSVSWNFRCMLSRWRKSSFQNSHDYNLYQCRNLEDSADNSHQAVAMCKFQKKQRTYSQYKKLDQYFASSEAKSLTEKNSRPINFQNKSYADFIGKGRCAAFSPDLGRLFFKSGGIVGLAVDQKLFDEDATCSKPHVYSSICSEDDKACLDFEENHFCHRIRNDLNASRLDKATMSMWTAGMSGPKDNFTNFFLPRTPPKPLLQLAIPGWSSKTIALERPKEEPKLAFEGLHGGFECMMEKLQDLAIEGEGGKIDVGNQYEVTAKNNLRSRDILDTYFRSFSYPDPFHFVVHESQLQTDSALEKLVFDSIGAHRLEVINRDEKRAVSLSPIGIEALQAIPYESILKGLPAKVEREAYFLIRMEGLFEDLPLRDKMDRWGGNAFFDAQGHVLALQYDGKTCVPGDSCWTRFKFIFRSSLVSHVTAFDHLVSAHIICSQSLTMASFETLPADHPLRILLAPHTWNALTLNFAAATNLFSPQALVHRASPFKKEAFGDVQAGMDGKIWQKTKLLRYKPFVETYELYAAFKRQQAQDFPEIPYFEDGILLYRTLKRYLTAFMQLVYHEDWSTCNVRLESDPFVSKFVTRILHYSEMGTEEFWPSEFLEGIHNDCKKFVSFFSEILFVVTGFHAQVGVVTDFFRDTSFVATTWKENETEARPKHAVLMMLLASLTTGNHPRMDQSLSDIYVSDAKNEIPMPQIFKNLFDDFHKELTNVQSIVEQRNKMRLNAGRLEFHQMEPKYLLYGVSV